MASIHSPWIKPIEARIIGEMKLDPSTVALWHFDEGIDGALGILHDASIYENNGILAAAPNTPTWVDGQIGKALDFDGNDYTRHPFHASMNIRDEFTWISWIYPDANFNGYILSKGGQYQIQVAMPQNGIWCQFYNAAALFPSRCTAPAIAMNTWWRIGVTLNTPGLPIIYINGEPATAYAYRNAVPGPIDAGVGDLYIGKDLVVVTPYYGKLDEMILSNRCYSHSEMRADYRRSPLAKTI